ncbi:MAG: hypothetical protein JO023_10215 [Chloroflexi bacterium]|nr:hypothetical protein [Chloroflexota bacterium]
MADQPGPPEEPLPPSTSGPTSVPPATQPEGPPSQAAWLVGGAIALIVAVVAIVFLFNRQPQAGGPPTTPTPVPATSTPVPSPSATTAPTPNLAATVEPAVAASVQAIQTGTALAQATAAAAVTDTPTTAPTTPPTPVPATPVPPTATPIVPTQPIVPALPSPSPSASPSPQAAAGGAFDHASPSGGLGNTRGNVDTAFGTSTGELPGALVVYRKGGDVQYRVTFTTDRPRAAIIAEVEQAGPPWTMDTATGESRKLFPRDSQPRGAAPETSGQRTLERFHSSWLAQAMPVEPALGGTPGDFLVVYEKNDQDQVTDIVVGIGDSADQLLRQIQE